jgi:hypothetical protein
MRTRFGTRGGYVGPGFQSRRPRTASFKRRKAPFTVLQTKTHNEKLAAKKAAAKKKGKQKR